jgi:PGF-CTERM protein
MVRPAVVLLVLVVATGTAVVPAVGTGTTATSATPTDASPDTTKAVDSVSAGTNADPFASDRASVTTDPLAGGSVRERAAVRRYSKYATRRAAADVPTVRGPGLNAADLGLAAGGRNGATTREVVVEHRTLDTTPGTPGSVEVTYRFELDGTTQLEIQMPALDQDGIEVLDTSGFSREGAADFTWDENTIDPTIRVRIPAGQTRMNEYSTVERDDWAFVSLPDTRARYWSRVDNPVYSVESTVAGEGFAAGNWAYAGPGERYSRETAFGTTVSVFVAEDAEPAADPNDLLVSVAILVEDFQVGLQYDQTAMFVLPAERTASRLTGQASGSNYWVQDDQARLDTVETTVTHEFAHTRIGSFQEGSAEWLTEGFATYYEHLLALNQGMGSFVEYRDSLHEGRSEYGTSGTPVRLTDPSSWESNDANYDKGGLVLAALDARIRNATGGERTLEDVLSVRFRAEDNYNQLQTYEDFRRAVVDVSGDSSLGNWLDRYATTRAVPNVPDDPYLYVTRWDADPDGDDLTNTRERELGTNPFSDDSDADRVPDSEEVAGPTDPTVYDTDDDGFLDRTELDGSTDPTNPDSDGDGVEDGVDQFPTDADRVTPTPTPTPEPTPTPSPTSTDEAPDGDDGGAEDTPATGPGFGVFAALVALLAIALLAARRE